MEPKRRISSAASWLRGPGRSTMSLVAMVVIGYALVHSIYRSLTMPIAIGSATVPTRHADGQVHIHDMNVLTSSKDALANREKVLVLTPLARFYDQWWSNLVDLEYPHELIDVGVIVPNSAAGDLVLEQLNEAVERTQNSAHKFRRITILRQDTPSLESQLEKDRHAMAVQKERRRDMALARNSLVFTTIQSDTSWVLWLDGDVVETPATLIQDLTSHDRDVLVANCFQRYTENGQQKKRPYDFNSWIDSDVARDMAANMGQDDILLEGYAEMATFRTLMAKLYSETGNIHEELELDGVGGTALMVRSDVHRDGAMFPPFAFYHLIETEGFAKMVKRLGYKVYGLPNYLVYHYNE